MKIIDILKQKSENPKDDVKIELKLYTLADDLEKRSRNHLKRITTVLTEFDIHDEKHSEKVIENIEKLLGEEKLKCLSTYELFLLHLSAFFHDCAMAPSDWEINTMKLTEGNETYFQNAFSIKHDLKTPLQFSAAQKVISENKANLYITFESDVNKWMFTPRSEDELIKYLSELLIDYQNYRNGFADKLKKVKNQEEFNDLSEFIRIDYIRATHHTRIETYVKNLETIFSQDFPIPAWGKKLAHDLSLICRSHGEDANYINSFSQNAQYYGSESTNLQLVAVMLRLGDIIHFSYDRAPIDLRSSKLFKSEYSFQQWAIKHSGVNYSIENGKISFRAYCETPETYFKLHQYIDWIEIEIQNYFRFQRQWSFNYIENLQDKVDRSNIINDEDVFLPKRGLSFTLNQNKILDLLMSVGLYKDKYACLRELYQNSLDAVRCMLSQSEINNSSTKGLIEFGISRDDKGSYLYCVDNGIGMTKEIIENYLLKLGNSYYKSSDFFKQQASWGGKFTPTSQFGIGILSCFMIGSKLEIITKTINGEYVSCAIEGLHESFYYKKTSAHDKEYIKASGTVIKVLLDDETASEINNKKISNADLLFLNTRRPFPMGLTKQSPYKERKEHLFTKLNYFIQVVPDNIDLTIGIEDGTKLNISSKPTLLKIENQNSGVGDKDLEFIDDILNFQNPDPLLHKFIDVKDFIENYKLHIQLENTEYITILTLPKKGFAFEGVKTLYKISEVDRYGQCIDGLYVDYRHMSEYYYLSSLSRSGIINFSGEKRPQISIDRTSIISYPKECEQIATGLSKLLAKKIILVANDYLIKHNITFESEYFHLVWEYIFRKFDFAVTHIINELTCEEHGSIIWKRLNDISDANRSIRDFLTAKNITIKEYNMSNADTLTRKILLAKLVAAEVVSVEGFSVSIKQESFLINNLLEHSSRYQKSLLISADHWQIFDDNFDLVSSLYPLVPKRFFDLFGGEDVKVINSRVKTIQYYGNGITTFFVLNPLLVNSKLGLYEESVFFGMENNSIYNFENKISKSWLSEINDFNQKDRYVILAYVAPRQLTVKEEYELEKYTIKDPSYVKGVREGWSILATSMHIDNVVIAPGKVTREHLISLISVEFWEKYKDYTFKFTDNTIMTKCTS